MKTIKKSTAEKRLNTLTIKSPKYPFPLSKCTKAYKFAKEVINGAKEIRPVRKSGYGRFSHNLDYTRGTCAVLEEIGIEFKLINDGPLEGAVHNLIIIETKIKP